MNRRERRELKRKFRKLENTIKRVKSSSDGEFIYQDDTGKFKTSIYRNLMSQVGERYNDTSNHNDAKAAEYIGYNKEYYDRNNFNIGNPYTYFDDVVTSGVPKNFKDSFFGFEPLPNDTPLPVKLLFSIRFLSLESVAKYSNEEGQIRSYSFLLAKTTNLDYGTFLMFNDEGAFFQSQDSFFLVDGMQAVPLTYSVIKNLTSNELDLVCNDLSDCLNALDKDQSFFER